MIKKIASIIIKDPRRRRYIGNIIKKAIKAPGAYFNNRKLKRADRKKYKKDMKLYSKLNEREAFRVQPDRSFPIYDEWRMDAGNIGSYFWQDYWCAKRLSDRNVLEHYDIGSRIDGFISHISLLKIKTVLIDIRPMHSNIPYISFVQEDATELKGIPSESINSISALCSLEHFGLGRYGDDVAPEAFFTAVKSIQRVVKKGGRIYISVPVGEECVRFNAHRVFNPETIVKEFSDCTLIEFSNVHVKEDGSVELQEEIGIERFNNLYSNGYGDDMGLFIFEKK